VHFYVFLGGIAVAAQTISLILTHFSTVWSAICHIRVPCLEHLMNLGAIWQVLFRGSVYIVLDGGP